MTQPDRSRRGTARRTRSFSALAAAVALSACASTPGDEFAADPFEPTNREIHEFNKGLDMVALRPAAQFYEFAMPGLFKLLISNGVNMLEMPAIVVNRLLQGDVERALEAAGRIGINVVFGGVLLDPATEFGLPKEDTDLGITFAEWGIDEGPYVELPLFGPNTARSAVGTVIEIIADPFNLIAGVPALDAVGYGFTAASIVDMRADNMNAVDQLLYESADSYSALRSVWVQRRLRTLEGGLTEESLPDVFDGEGE